MNDVVRIQLATLTDLSDIESCARAAYSKYIQRMNQVPAPMVADFSRQIEQEHVHIARCASGMTGYVVFYPVKDNLHLENIAVHPRYSGQSIGKKLIQFAERVALDAGLQAVELYTNEAMTENLVMYTKLGYIETHRMQQAGFHRVFFRKTV